MPLISQKYAAALQDRLTGALQNIKASPVAQLAHGVANLSPQGRQLVERAQGAAQRLQDVAGRVEAHPAYHAAQSAHQFAQDLRQDPLVRQHIIEPIKGSPITQAAMGAAREVAAPAVARVQGAVQGANQLVQQANAAAAPVVPIVQTAHAAQQRIQQGQAQLANLQQAAAPALDAAKAQLANLHQAAAPAVEAAKERGRGLLAAAKAKAENLRAQLQEATGAPTAPTAPALEAPAAAAPAAPATPAAPAAAPAAPATPAAPADPDRIRRIRDRYQEPEAPAQPASPSFFARLRDYLFGVANRYGVTDPNTQQSFIQAILARLGFGQQPAVKTSALSAPSYLRLVDHLKTGSESGAWQRSEGKNPEGGLNAKGRASLKAQGHDIKPGVKGKADTPDKQRRKGSFLSRMFGPGAPGSMKKDNGEPSRRALSAKAWGEPVPRDDAGRARLYAKGQALLAKYRNSKKAEEEAPEYERKARLYADKYHAALLARLKAEHEARRALP